MDDGPHSDGGCEQKGEHKDDVKHWGSDDVGFGSVELDGRSLSRGILKWCWDGTLLCFRSNKYACCILDKLHLCVGS